VRVVCKARVLVKLSEVVSVSSRNLYIGNHLQKCKCTLRLLTSDRAYEFPYLDFPLSTIEITDIYSHSNGLPDILVHMVTSSSTAHTNWLICNSSTHHDTSHDPKVIFPRHPKVALVQHPSAEH
jgi:hypothetical protein